MGTPASHADLRELLEPRDPDSLASPFDIPVDVAVRAFMGVSHSPERRGRNSRREYARGFNTWAKKQRRLGTAEDADWLQERLHNAQQRFRHAFLAYLSSKAGTTSWLVTGPAGRNNRREDKKHDTADRRRADAEAVLTSSAAQIRKELKVRAGRRAAAAAGLDVDKLSRAKLLAAGQAQSARSRAATAVRAGTSSRSARAAAERDAELQARLKTTGSQTFAFAAGDVAHYQGQLHRPAGRLVLDFDDDRARLHFDERLGKEPYRLLIKGYGWKWSRKHEAAQRQITPSALQSAERITGLKLPSLAERFEEVRQASDEAAAAVQATRKAKKAAARAGEGTFAEVLAVAMKRRAQFKLTPANAKKALSPSVRVVRTPGRGTAGYMLTYKTGETDKSPFGSGALVPHGRRLGVRVVTGSEARVEAFSNQYRPTDSTVGRPVSLELSDTLSAEDVPRVVAAIRRLLQQLGLERIPLTYLGS